MNNSASITIDVRDLIGAQRKSDGSRIQECDVRNLLGEIEEYAERVNDVIKAAYDQDMFEWRWMQKRLDGISRKAFAWSLDEDWDALHRMHGTIAEQALIAEQAI